MKLTLVIGVLGCSLCFATGSQPFKFSQCTPAPTNPSVKLTGFVLPDPVPNGGRYTFTVTAHVYKSIPGCTQLKHKPCRKAFFTCIPYPTCADDFGTCTFPVCHRPGFPNYNPLWYSCSDNSNGGVINPGIYYLNQTVYFPQLSGFEGFLVNGDYESTTTLEDGSGNVLGCYKINYSVQDQTWCPHRNQ